MSTFTNRLNQIGEFSIGPAKFAVLEVRGAWIKCAQTHNHDDGGALPEFSYVWDSDGRLEIGDAIDAFPGGFVVPQTHAAFNAIKAQIADLDNQQLELCSVCVGNSVTLQDMTNACHSCLANSATISYLKTV